MRGCFFLLYFYFLESFFHPFIEYQAKCDHKERYCEEGKYRSNYLSCISMGSEISISDTSKSDDGKVETIKISSSFKIVKLDSTTEDEKQNNSYLNTKFFTKWKCFIDNFFHIFFYVMRYNRYRDDRVKAFVQLSASPLVLLFCILQVSDRVSSYFT